MLLLNRGSNNKVVNYQSETLSTDVECVKTFIEAYNTVPQTILQNANVFFPVVSLQSNIDTNSATGEFTIKTDGVYSVAIGIAASAVVTPSIAQFSVYVNGLLKLSTPFVAVEGALLSLKVGDIVTVRNTSQSGSALTNVNFGLNPSVTAKIVMYKI